MVLLDSLKRDTEVFGPMCVWIRVFVYKYGYRVDNLDTCGYRFSLVSVHKRFGVNEMEDPCIDLM